MRDFITKHQKIVTVIGAILAIGFIIFVASNSFNSSSEPTGQSEMDGGVDGASESDPIPYVNSLYSINYNAQSTEGVPDTKNLIVNTYPEYLTTVINKLHDFGFNTAEYNITFTNYENPFNAYK